MKHLLYPFTVILGIVIGLSGYAPEWIHQHSLPQILLYILIIQVGLTLGMRPDLKKIFKSVRPKLFILPLCTIVGTLGCTLLATFIFREDSLTDIMAIGSGFGYYTLSSMLIGQFKEATIGPEGAAALASVALLTNVVREMLGLVSCRFLSKRGYGMAAISVAGINSMDVCLPMIIGDRQETTDSISSDSQSDSQLVPAALLHGITLEISVPILVAAFCS